MQRTEDRWPSARNELPEQDVSIRADRSAFPSMVERDITHSTAHRYPDLILQPESSPISKDQLAAEVKGIYAGLVMVEAKCINIDNAQACNHNSYLGPEQWQALIALHRTLLYEHHDFLMATQHPSATPALHSLANRYSMPARMWKHAIHAFLEVLRHRRPESQDYMLAFIYLAYQMMALLFETVPTFTDAWIECLGDLARYRMAIEEERMAHNPWAAVVERWYRTTAGRHPNPKTGRLNHHLGILERLSIRRVDLYARSITCVVPSTNARYSLAALVGELPAGRASVQPLDAHFVTPYAKVFFEAREDTWSKTMLETLTRLARPSDRTGVASQPHRLGWYLSSQWRPKDLPDVELAGHKRHFIVDLVLDQIVWLLGLSSLSGAIVSSDQRHECAPRKRYFRSTRTSHSGAEATVQSTARPYGLPLDSNLMPKSFLASGLCAYAHTSSSPMSLETGPWEALCEYQNIFSENLFGSALDSAAQDRFADVEGTIDAFQSLPEDSFMRGLAWSRSYHHREPSDKQCDDDNWDMRPSSQRRAMRTVLLGMSLQPIHMAIAVSPPGQLQLSTVNESPQNSLWAPVKPSLLSAIASQHTRARSSLAQVYRRISCVLLSIQSMRSSGVLCMVASFVPGVSALPIQESSNGFVKDALSTFSGSLLPLVPFLFLTGGACSVYWILRKPRHRSKQPVLLSVMVTVSALVWWAIRITHEEPDDGKNITIAAWFALWTNNMAQDYQSLKHKNQFLVASILGGLFTTLLVAALASINPKEASSMPRVVEQAINCGPLCLSVWASVIYWPLIQVEQSDQPGPAGDAVAHETELPLYRQSSATPWLHDAYRRGINGDVDAALPNPW